KAGEECLRSRNVLGAQITWVTAAADRARIIQLSLIKQGEVVSRTIEEQLLKALVMARGELDAVFNIYAGKLGAQFKPSYPIEDSKPPLATSASNLTLTEPSENSLSDFLFTSSIQHDNSSIIPATTQAIAKVNPIFVDEREGPTKQKTDQLILTRETASGTGEDLQQFFKECEIARDNCRIFCRYLENATPSSIASNSQIKELRENCLKSRETISAQINRVFAFANQARIKRASVIEPDKTTPRTVDEQLLKALVICRAELNAVFAIYSDLTGAGGCDSKDTNIPVQVQVELPNDITAHGGSRTGSPGPTSLAICHFTQSRPHSPVSTRASLDLKIPPSCERELPDSGVLEEEVAPETAPKTQFISSRPPRSIESEEALIDANMVS
ncbi:hypothetical protein FRC11_004470, partial [Ceratobasidium sp. 423]